MTNMILIQVFLISCGSFPDNFSINKPHITAITPFTISINSLSLYP